MSKYIIGSKDNESLRPTLCDITPEEIMSAIVEDARRETAKWDALKDLNVKHVKQISRRHK